MRFFLTNPHFHTFIPDDIAGRINPEANLINMQEVGIEEIIDWPGVAVVNAEIHQAVINLNRARNDIHPLTGIPYPPQLKLFPEEDFSGAPIFREGESLSDDEKEKMLVRYYDPFYAKVRENVDSGNFDFFIDCHLMNNDESSYTDMQDDERPDICLGNLGDAAGQLCEGREYISFDPEVLNDLKRRISAFGYSCELNIPFSGGNIIQQFGREFPCFLLEINKKIFMHDDEGGMMKNKLRKLSMDLYNVFVKNETILNEKSSHPYIHSS